MRRLGAGGMGEVWIGQRVTVGGAAKRVAVKMLRPERATDEGARRSFLEEARLSVLLSNSNIVQVFDVGEAEDGTCYMAMEWVEGLNLSELAAALHDEGETLPPMIIGFIIGELLKALAYAHDLNIDGQTKIIVHRDVSPQNVMISVAGEVKLMDFGIARIASEETNGQFVRGKLRYMPPEQLRGETRGPTIDLFGVGAILHELLDGKKFRGGVIDETRLYGMILDGEVPALSVAVEVPAQLETLRCGLLQADLEDRLPSARAAHDVLSRWPGYRDAKFDLQDLVRRFMRAEPSPEPSPELEVAATMILPTDGSHTEPSRSSVRAGQSEQSEQSESRTEIERRPAAEAPGRPRNTSSMRLTIALAAVGLGFGLVGARSILSVWTDVTADPGASDPVSELAPAPASTSTPTVDTESAPTPAPESAPAPAPEPQPQPALVPELEPEPAPVEASAPSNTKSKRRSKPEQEPKQQPETDVTFIAGKLKAVEIEIGGRSAVLEPIKTLRLPAGKHEVHYRKDSSSPWLEAGTIHIEAGKSYRAKLQDPHGIQLSESEQ